MSGPSERPVIRSFDEAIACARELLVPGRRRILGIVGATERYPDRLLSADVVAEVHQRLMEDWAS